MGHEAKCTARVQGKKDEGKALLETSELIFRGTERVKITFADMKNVAAEDGVLRIKTESGDFAFAIGAAAEKWREKILHPKSRAEKLGVKAGTKVAVLGEIEPAFAAELRRSKAQVMNEAECAELVFLPVANQTELKKVGGAAKKLQGASGLWIVYPKGKKEITEVDVINAGRKAGLKDVKVVGFSRTHTALKFVIPVDRR